MSKFWRALQFWTVLLFVGATLCIALASLGRNAGGH